jgi:hypothetical protein
VEPARTYRGKAVLMGVRTVVSFHGELILTGVMPWPKNTKNARCPSRDRLAFSCANAPPASSHFFELCRCDFPVASEHFASLIKR